MRRLVAQKVLALSYACIAFTSIVIPAPQARSEVIYQAFDEKFTAIEDKLDRLSRLGYAYVQVSPPQKSAALKVWWARYQPLDFQVIDGPLGDEADLRHLIEQAHKRGLKILVDVVFNHMADPSFNGGSLNYPQFSARDFHHADDRRCIEDYSDRRQVTGFWLCDLSLNHHLPDLDTSSAYVRGVHKAYLRKLLDLGADGFRFDAAKHIEADYFRDILASLPKGTFSYGEVIAESLAESGEYTPMMPVTDFHLLRVMLLSFSLNGDLRSLIDPESYGAALPGRSAVVFARNHDTAMHKDFFNFGDLRDSLLATAFVVARGVGTAMVYRDDYTDEPVATSVKFHRDMRGKPTYVRRAEEVCAEACDPSTLIFVERGDCGVMILNTADAWVDMTSARMPGLATGCYREIKNDFKIGVSVGGDGQKWVSYWGSSQRGGLNIGPRTALFFEKVSSGPCQGEVVQAPVL